MNYGDGPVVSTQDGQTDNGDGPVISTQEGQTDNRDGPVVSTQEGQTDNGDGSVVMHNMPVERLQAMDRFGGGGDLFFLVGFFF